MGDLRKTNGKIRRRHAVCRVVFLDSVEMLQPVNRGSAAKTMGRYRPEQAL